MNKTIDALKRACMLLQSIVGAKVSSEIVDIYPEEIKPKVIEDIFGALNMPFEKIADTGYKVSVPTDKFDVIREADVIEEIIRIYGLNKIPIPTKINASISSDKTLQPLKIKSKLSDVLAGMGFFEMMAVSLSQSSYYEKALPRDMTSLVYVNNTSNRDSNIMRPDMLISGLEVIQRNQNRQNADLRLFEFGKIYHQAENGIKEQNRLSVFLTGQANSESWMNPDKNMVSFYDLKSTVKLILEKLAIQGFQIESLSDDALTYGQKYFRGPNPLVKIVSTNLRQSSRFHLKA